MCRGMWYIARMKKLVFYNLVLVATLLVCRSESTTEFSPDTSKVEVGSSKDQDIEDESTQDSLPQEWNVWSTIKGILTTAFGAATHTVSKKAEEFTEYVYTTTIGFSETFLQDVLSSIKRKFKTAFGTVTKRAEELTEYVHTTTTEFADKFVQDFSSSIKEIFANAFGAVTHTVYKKVGEFAEYVYNTTAEFAEKVRNTTAEFAEKVRHVFREEFSNFLASLLGDSSIGDPASGKIIVQCIRVGVNV